MVKLGAHFFVTVVSVFTILGCFEIVEPSAPDGGTGDTNVQQCVDGCACDQVDVAGHVYRFSLLSVDEPGAISGQLDSLWEVELENYLLNVLFVVDEVEVSDDSDEAFSSIQLTAGSGWRFPTTGGYYDEKVGEVEVETFCFLDEELNVDVSFTPTGKDACTFENTDTKTLFFHIGAQDDPLECAPLLEPANSTPLHDLKVTFGFNANCDKIVDGRLEGCLPQYEVNRICMCSMTGTCGRDNQDEDYPFPEPDTDGVYENLELTKYCVNRCGEGFTGTWTSFGVSMASFGEYCETEEGDPGYILSAFFEAEDITSMFSENLDDCRDDK